MLLLLVPERQRVLNPVGFLFLQLNSAGLETQRTRVGVQGTRKWPVSLFVCNFQPNYVSVACVKTSCRAKSMTDDKQYFIGISSRSPLVQVCYSTLAE